MRLVIGRKQGFLRMCNHVVSTYVRVKLTYIAYVGDWSGGRVGGKAGMVGLKKILKAHPIRIHKHARTHTHAHTHTPPDSRFRVNTREVTWKKGEGGV